ncbi:MAG: hypothetical protein ACRC33_07520, partial [Gemmataceae bacterium]
MYQVGFGVGDITPEVGMDMPGGFLPNPGKGVRDHPLLAVACVVSDGTRTVALVGIDALFIGKSTVERCRRVIQKETKIPAEHVLIGTNHTHSGGPINDTFYSPPDAKYLEIVVKGITSAVIDGARSLHAAEIGVGTGREDGIAFNRRFIMRDGREITHPGKPGTPHHGQIVGPAGPTDPDVGVLAARDPKGNVRGVVVHFSCHSTVVGGNLFSPDYAGYLRKHLKAVYGPATPVCFLLGACGDITQVDNLSTSADFGPAVADLMGRKLAAEAERTIRRMKWEPKGAVDAHTVTVPVAIRDEPDPSREVPPFGLGSDGKDRVYGKIFDAEKQKVAEERKKSPILQAEVQALRVGPLGVVGTGAE